jgi:hypothetical protein
MKLEKVTVTIEQVVSINQAIQMLMKSESDHADQCILHLKKLAVTLSKAKIITEGKQ